jgi:hypothetical protein
LKDAENQKMTASQMHDSRLLQW